MYSKEILFIWLVIGWLIVFWASVICMFFGWLEPTTKVIVSLIFGSLFLCHLLEKLISYDRLKQEVIKQ